MKVILNKFKAVRDKDFEKDIKCSHCESILTVDINDYKVYHGLVDVKCCLCNAETVVSLTYLQYEYLCKYIGEK